MIQEVLHAKSVDGAYWSLQAELFFYTNALVLYFLGAFRRFNITILGWLGFSAMAGLIIGYSEITPLVSGLQKLQTLLSLEYIPLFGIGICLHELYRGRCSRQAAMGLIIACFTVQWLRVDSPKAIVDLVLAGIVATAIFRPVPGLASRPLLFLGAVSYPLYIIHQNIGYVIIRSLEGTNYGGNIAIVLAITVALVLAFLITKYVDRPAQQRLRPLLKQFRFESVWLRNLSRRNKRLHAVFDQAGNQES
jgi:peptidoglycan/LPS O-acetylase OafA/YrhL